jgi:Spy/CpxP family protein refolding chaperone
MIRQRSILTGIPLLAALTILSSTVAFAQIDESLEQKLGLTTAQRNEIEQLRTQFKEDSAPIKSRIKELQANRRELEQSGADQARIKAVLEKIADEEIELSLLLNKFKRDYLAVFTEEQLAKLREMKKQRKSD